MAEKNLSETQFLEIIIKKPNDQIKSIIYEWCSQNSIEIDDTLIKLKHLVSYRIDPLNIILSFINNTKRG